MMYFNIKMVVIFFLGVVICLGLQGQNVENFIGRYEIKELCNVTEPIETIDTVQRIIDVTASKIDSFDIQLDYGLVELVGASLMNDSTFLIPQQVFPNYGNPIYLSGEGHFFKDSIQITVRRGGPIGLIGCIGKGVKMDFISVQENEYASTNILLSPNPAYHNLIIQQEHAIYVLTNASLSVFDLSGTRLKQLEIFGRDKPYTLNIDELRAGTYLLRLSQGSKILQTKKFIKL